MSESQCTLHEIYFMSDFFSSRSVLSSQHLVSTANSMQYNIYSSLVKRSYRGKIFCLDWCKGPNHRNNPSNSYKVSSDAFRIMQSLREVYLQ